MGRQVPQGLHVGSQYGCKLFILREQSPESVDMGCELGGAVVSCKPLQDSECVPPDLLGYRCLSHSTSHPNEQSDRRRVLAYIFHQDDLPQDNAEGPKHHSFTGLHQSRAAAWQGGLLFVM